jgi:hypothetical protein
MGERLHHARRVADHQHEASAARRPRQAAIIALTLRAALSGPAGCGADTTATTACDPLLARESPAALAAVVAAGRHADGTLYVIDRDGEYRAFVSEAGTLFRRRVAGSGSGSAFVVVSITESNPQLMIKAELDGPQVIRMGVVRGPLEGRDFTIGEKGDVLDVLATDSVKGLPVRGLDGGVYVEYNAMLPSGEHLVVIRPTDDWDYDDFRVFFGRATAVAERSVGSVTRQRDGGTTDVVFELDGANVSAHFPAQSRMERAWIQRGGQMEPLELAAQGSRPDGLAFLCLRR